MDTHIHQPKKKISKWKVATVVLAILLIIVIFTKGFSFKGADGSISENDAKDKALNFIKENLLQPGVEVNLNSIAEESGLYKLDLSLNMLGKVQNVPAYVSKDGKLLLLQAFELDKGLSPGTTQPAEKIEVSADDDAFLGKEDAPITIVEFSDFQCPFCSRFDEDTLPELKEKYIDTGKVKFVYRDYPLEFHQYAQKAAEASECADEQGKYWEYHDILFKNQDKLTVDDLKKYTAELKLDTTKFNECLDSSKYKEEVEKDFNDGQSYGVSGTPAFFVNGILISGAQPFSAFEEIIEQELNK